jgi:hypothetical protein
MNRLFLTLAALLVLASCASPVRRESVAPLHPYVGDLRTVDVEIAGRPARLLFDTAAGITSITPAFAAELGCSPHGHLTAFRMDGGRVVFQRCPAMEVRIGDAVRRRQLGVFDLSAVLPPDLPSIDGIAGLDLFDGEIITILPGLSGLRIGDPHALANAPPAQLRLAREAAGTGLTIFVAARTGEGDAWLLVDSANLADVRLHPWALAALRPTESQTEPGTLVLSVEGVAPRRVAIEPVEDLIYDGVLNARFLASYTVTLDLAAGRIWWRPAETGEPSP